MQKGDFLMGKWLLILVIIFLPIISYSGSITSPRIIVSEIAWMGTKSSFNHEWFEITNITGSSIDLSQGWIIRVDTLSIQPNFIITPYQSVIFERSTQSVIPSIMGIIYSSVLNNSGGKFEIYNDLGNIEDSVDMTTGWCAGDNSQKITMTRIATSITTCEAWENSDSTNTYLDSSGNISIGSPGFFDEALFDITTGSGSEIIIDPITETGSTTGTGSLVDDIIDDIPDTSSGSLIDEVFTSSGALLDDLVVDIIQPSDILIIEVDPKSSTDFAILYSRNQNLNLRNCILTDLDGEDSYIVDQDLYLDEGDTLKVYWGQGTNNLSSHEIYINDSDLSGTDDQLVLVCDDLIIDAVIWTDGNGSISAYEMQDINYLIQSGQWVGNATETSLIKLDTKKAGSIKRKNTDIDTNSANDFEFVPIVINNPTPVITYINYDTPIIKSSDINTTPDIQSDCTSFSSTTLYISEVLANPDGSDTGNEFIEIVNTGTKDINLGCFTLADGFGSVKIFKLPKLLLEPSEVYTVYSSQSKISLNNSEEVVRLKNSQGSIIDELKTSASQEGISAQRIFEGGKFVDLVFQTATPGALLDRSDIVDAVKEVDSPAENLIDGSTSLAIKDPDADLIITSFNPNPKGNDETGEYIEIQILTSGSYDIYSLNINGKVIKLSKVKYEVLSDILRINLSNTKNSGGNFKLMKGDEIIQNIDYPNLKDGQKYVYKDGLWSIDSLANVVASTSKTTTSGKVENISNPYYLDTNSGGGGFIQESENHSSKNYIFYLLIPIVLFGYFIFFDTKKSKS